MNWYRTIKLAGPLNKIQSLGEEDPYFQAFIYKYEDIIPWQKIPDLSAFRIYAYSLTISLIKEIRDMPEGETKTILNNWDMLIDGWAFKDTNYARRYLMLKPLLDYAKTHTAPPPVAMPEAAVPIMEEIKDNPSKSINFLREYRKNMDPMPRKDGWHLFPQKSDFNDLYLFTQGAGWCLSTERYAKSYLDDHDIWIHVDDGVPVVAVTIARDGIVKEVRGRFNNLPYEYNHEVESKASEENWDTRESNYYKLTVNLPRISEELEENPNNEAALKQFLELLTECPLSDKLFEAYRGLSEEAKKTHSIRKTMEKYITKEMAIRGDVRAAEVLPRDVQNDFVDFLTKKLNEAIYNGRIFYIGKDRLSGLIVENLDIQKLAENFKNHIYNDISSMDNIDPIVLDHIRDEDLAKMAIASGQTNIERLSADFRNALGNERISNITNLITEYSKEKMFMLLNQLRDILRHTGEDPRPIFKLMTPDERQTFMKYASAIISEYIDREIVENAAAMRYAERDHTSYGLNTVYVPRELEEKFRNIFKQNIEYYYLDEDEVKTVSSSVVFF